MIPDTQESARPTIAILDPRVIDQIAAGEVVERPSSVVKELVENALDAGATHIAVEIERGGKDVVRVIDDGCGMTADDIKLALQRHATSKICAVADLMGLSTMGFRGEALPSIAAVSRMTITSRTRGEVAGARVVIAGGRIESVSEVGAPVGTVIEVRDLLFNVPARLKFLKGDATETSHISDTLSKLAMAHPHVHVRLKSGARKTLDAPAHTSQYERARALLGSRFGGRLHEASGEENGVQVTAFLAAPELAQSTSRGMQLYVGRRAVRDRGLQHAIVMGYGELVPKGRYPVAVLFVEVPSPDLDVNVHPQKLEVRFSDAQKVYSAVRHVIGRSVGQAPWLAERVAVGSAPVRMEAIAAHAPPAPRRASEMAASYARERERMLLPLGRPRPSQPTPRPSPAWRLPPPVSAPRPAPVVGERRSEVRPEREAPAELEASTFFSSLRYIGQLDKTYLLCEMAGELVLIDQHAAHERVEFQRLRERYREESLPVQRLLFPHRVELSEQEAALVADAGEALAAVGFELEPFGGTDFAVKAVPAGLRGDEPVGVLRELLGELVERGGSRAVDERIDMVFATIACHSVVRAGDVLSDQEAVALLESMDEVDYKAHCPHGRPVLLRISVAEIARRFGRT